MHIILKEHWQGLSPPKVWIFIKIIHTTPAISESVMRILKLWKNRGDPYVHKIYIQWLEKYQHWSQLLHMLATIVPFLHQGYCLFIGTVELTWAPTKRCNPSHHPEVILDTSAFWSTWCHTRLTFGIFAQWTQNKGYMVLLTCNVYKSDIYRTFLIVNIYPLYEEETVEVF
jgi:hypothetical protein